MKTLEAGTDRWYVAESVAHALQEYDATLRESGGSAALEVPAHSDDAIDAVLAIVLPTRFRLFAGPSDLADPRGSIQAADAIDAARWDEEQGLIASSR
jgi:hypothetical protein